MHPKVISDKTLEKILYELKWIVFDIILRTLKFMSRDIILFKKNCIASGTNKIAHNLFESDLLHVMNITKLNFIKLIFPLNKRKIKSTFNKVIDNFLLLPCQKLF